MTEAKRRRQVQDESVTTIDGNKIVLGIGAVVVLLGVGALAFWFAGRSSGPAITRQPAAHPQAQVQQVQPAPQSKLQSSSRSSTTQAQAQGSSQVQSNGGSGGVSVGLAGDSSTGEVAPDFSVPTLDGGTFNLAERRGQPAVVFFMAYWCPTCVPEARALQKLHEEYGDQVSILALDVDPSSSPEELQGI